MTDLIAMLSTGKGSWTHVIALMKAENWENVYLVTNKFGAERFTSDMPVKMIVLDENWTMEQMKQAIMEQLKDKLKLDIAVNLISGTGQEHMALMSALISLGVGIRLAIEDHGMKEI